MDASERWDMYEITFSLEAGDMDDAIALCEEFEQRPNVTGAVLSASNDDATHSGAVSADPNHAKPELLRRCERAFCGIYVDQRATIARLEGELREALQRPQGAVSVERDALDYMTGGIDREPWVTVYREAGGGYAGLQAVAQAALDATTAREELDDRPTPSERSTLRRCADCGWVTVGGSIHGCVHCLSKREPKPFEVVPVGAEQVVQDGPREHREPVEVVCPDCGKTLQIVPGHNAARHVVTADAPCKDCRAAAHAQGGVDHE